MRRFPTIISRYAVIVSVLTGSETNRQKFRPAPPANNRCVAIHPTSMVRFRSTHHWLQTRWFSPLSVTSYSPQNNTVLLPCNSVDGDNQEEANSVSPDISIPDVPHFSPIHSSDEITSDRKQDQHDRMHNVTIESSGVIDEAMSGDDTISQNMDPDQLQIDDVAEIGQQNHDVQWTEVDDATVDGTVRMQIYQNKMWTTLDSTSTVNCMSLLLTGNETLQTSRHNPCSAAIKVDFEVDDVTNSPPPCESGLNIPSPIGSDPNEYVWVKIETDDSHRSKEVDLGTERATPDMNYQELLGQIYDADLSLVPLENGTLHDAISRVMFPEGPDHEREWLKNLWVLYCPRSPLDSENRPKAPQGFPHSAFDQLFTYSTMLDVPIVVHQLRRDRLKICARNCTAVNSINVVMHEDGSFSPAMNLLHRSDRGVWDPDVFTDEDSHFDESPYSPSDSIRTCPNSMQLTTHNYEALLGDKLQNVAVRVLLLSPVEVAIALKSSKFDEQAGSLDDNNKMRNFGCSRLEKYSPVTLSKDCRKEPSVPEYSLFKSVRELRKRKHNVSHPTGLPEKSKPKISKTTNRHKIANTVSKYRSKRWNKIGIGSEKPSKMDMESTHQSKSPNLKSEKSKPKASKTTKWRKITNTVSKPRSKQYNKICVRSEKASKMDMESTQRSKCPNLKCGMMVPSTNLSRHRWTYHEENKSLDYSRKNAAVCPQCLLVHCDRTLCPMHHIITCRNGKCGRLVTTASCHNKECGETYIVPTASHHLDASCFKCLAKLPRFKLKYHMKAHRALQK